jgi:hypothetical protein
MQKKQKLTQNVAKKEKESAREENKIREGKDKA